MTDRQRLVARSEFCRLFGAALCEYAKTYGLSAAIQLLADLVADDPLDPEPAPARSSRSRKAVRS